MSIAVWADVGGTFTDCIVSDQGRRVGTKVLSSGLVRAGVDQKVDKRSLQLSSLAGAAIPGFWVGAKLSVLLDNGKAQPIGVVHTHDAKRLQLDRDVTDTLFARSGIVVELDAGLEAPVVAARLLLGIPFSQGLPALEVRLGSTRGTNALLTRQGATTALVVTAGFGDVLRIGEQDRPELFALAIKKPPPLTETVVEAAERMDAEGNVLTPIDIGSLRDELLRLKASHVQSLAICLLHAHVNPAHEIEVEQLAREIGFQEISRSSEVAPLIKLVSRAETTTLDAYLNPILAGYVKTVWEQFGGRQACKLRLMTSGGNLVAPSAFRGRDSILSGPAGGVVALGHVARQAGSVLAVGLDMGGTSTDVSRFEGEVGRRYESRVAGVRVMTPMMDIETVAAGGGSICDYTREGRLVVGPASAGADPGPACYGKGGPLTVTDVNLLLGRIPPSHFPFPIRETAAASRLSELLARANRSKTFDSPEALAEGFLNIAVTHMAEAVRTVSTAKGTDVRRMTLVGFGGAAGQHLCRVARALGMRRILDHPDAGMLSALGMGLADVGRVVTKGIYRDLDRVSEHELNAWSDDLKNEADRQLKGETDGAGRTVYRYQGDLRYVGTDSTLALPLDPSRTLSQRFHEAHRAAFGYAQQGRSVELVAIRCDAVLQHATAARESGTSTAPSVPKSVRFWHGSRWIDASLIERDGLSAGQRIAAPAMIVSDHSTLVLEPGWEASVLDDGVIELTPGSALPGVEATDGQTSSIASDPVMLEVIARRLQGIADSMGEVLRRTSISVNVKERRDYSCAIFRRDGSLVANAPHVPVHLGAMGHTVRHLKSVFDVMHQGDCYLSNDPYAGGSHLPDITAVTPVFCGGKNSGSPDFFVASRAHHAEIGGRTPGSMPPDARSLAEEGVVIRDFAMVRSGIANIDKLRELLSSGPFPSRCVDENLADIAAQQAAGAQGAAALQALTQEQTVSGIDGIMGQLLEVAGEAMSHWIETLPTEPMRFGDVLDDETSIGVVIRRNSADLSIEFETGPAHPNGFNATPAIVTAAVLYVLRSVCDTDLPLCDGVLRDVSIRMPKGLLDPPFDPDPEKCPAVVAGNVETSQRIVDVLLGALGVAAASQGTMNNVLIGDDTFGYYETIGGGAGATAAADGADAVHCHMTNTRITDPEVLESRLPVRLKRFAIRTGSGGAGRHRGGDGMIREFEFLRPLVVSLITSRRTHCPYGVAGGAPGSPGKNLWIRDGKETALDPSVTIQVAMSDQLRIETPGGGGFGPPGSSRP